MTLRPVVAFVLALNVVVWGGLFAFEAFLASESDAIVAAQITSR